MNFHTAVYALLIAFGVSVILCPLLIHYLVKLKFGQYVREDGPKDHLRKAGTPTMGGIMIILSFLLASIFFLAGNREGAALMLVTLSFGVIGFVDDYISVVKRRSLGLRAYQKILAQVLTTLVFLFYCFTLPYFSTQIMIPFFPDFFVHTYFFLLW